MNKRLKVIAASAAAVGAVSLGAAAGSHFTQHDSTDTAPITTIVPPSGTPAPADTRSAPRTPAVAPPPGTQTTRQPQIQPPRPPVTSQPGRPATPENPTVEIPQGGGMTGGQPDSTGGGMSGGQPEGGGMTSGQPDTGGTTGP